MPLGLGLLGWTAVLFPAVVLGMAELLTVTAFGFPLMAAFVSAVVVPSTNTAGLGGRFPFVIYFLLSK